MDANPTDAMLPEAFCLGCDYPLRGLTEYRCPECDREFDLNQSWTFATRRPMTRLAKWLLKPPGWIFLSTTAVAAGLMLWAHTPPDAYFGLFLIAFGLWLLVGGLWFVSGIAFLVTNASYGYMVFSSPRFKWDCIRWLVIPLTAVIVIGLLVVRLPHRIARRLSYPAMQALVKDYQRGQLHDVERVGLYPVDSIETTSHGFSFRIPCGFMDSYGFEYAPDGAPENIPYTRTYRHYRDDWYYYEEEF